MIELNVAGSNAPALVDDAWAHLAQYKWKLDKNGYVERRSAGRHILLHQVVMPGDRWPTMVRDHISRDKLDNRLANLRWVTPAGNAQNRGAHRCNGVGVRGVRYDRSKGMYLARVQHNGKAVARQWFASLKDAEAYLSHVRPAIFPLSA